MPTIDHAGRQLEINEEEFLVHPDEWNEDLAPFLA